MKNLVNFISESIDPIVWSKSEPTALIENPKNLKWKDLKELFDYFLDHKELDVDYYDKVGEKYMVSFREDGNKIDIMVTFENGDFEDQDPIHQDIDEFIKFWEDKLKMKFNKK